jgi:hypothetical protein
MKYLKYKLLRVEFFFNDAQFTEMFSLAKIGVKEIISRQKEALK